VDGGAESVNEESEMPVSKSYEVIIDDKVII
jgi:hypothetical protein